MKNNKPFFIVAWISLIIAILLTSVDFWVFNRSFYAEEYHKINTAEEIGMSSSDLDKTTDVLLGYIHDDNDDLTTYAIVDGSEREVFNSKEKLHMVDVKNLYLNAMKVRNVLLIVAIVLLFVALFKKDLKQQVKPMNKTYLTALMIIGAAVCAILFYALIDFENFWLQFHYVFFTNDLFYLDPNTDILIMMVPSQFFFDLVIRIIVSFIVAILAIFGIGKLVEKKVEKC